MCKKQTSVSHSLTESEIISFEAGLRLDGLPALEVWDLIVSVLGNMTQTTERTRRPVIIDRSQRSQGQINALNGIDCVPSNVQSSHQEALLCVFEDNEEVIKMIIKGRSPTMRHVSRTRRVALDWLFDRINLDPKIQIKYIDTKYQLADTLTKGNFTGDEWNHLLCLFNISHFSSTICSAAMAKRIQQESGEERVTAKIATNDESYCKGAVARIILDFSKPGEEKLRKSRSMEFDYCYTEQFMESFSSASYTKWDDDRAWSSQEWKTDIETYELSGRPDETSWGTTRESRPGFSHEETLHDGTAQSVVNEGSRIGIVSRIKILRESGE